MTDCEPDIFVLGAPRSGTTWLQRLLGAHPQIATPWETHFVHEFAAVLEAAWRRQMEGIERSLLEQEDSGAPHERHLGLPALLTEDEFYGALRDMYGALRSRAFQLKPEATTFLEKTPSNSLHVQLLAQLAPGCHFIHLVRHPSDVVASLLAASRGWGGVWAPTSADSAARTYRVHVEAALSAERFGSRYHMIRYEDLRADPVRELQALLDGVGIQVSDKYGEKMVEIAELASSRGGADADPLLLGGEIARRMPALQEPEGFFGPGATGRKRRELTVYQQWCVSSQNSHLLQRLGYPPTWPVSSTKSAVYRGRRTVARLSRGLGHELGRLASMWEREQFRRSSNGGDGDVETSGRG